MLKTFPTICASVAGNPSVLGVKMHNAAYKACGIDYTYVAMGAEDITEALQALKLLNYRGLAVSMPFKQNIIKHLNRIDESVSAIGACNTVVNDGGVLVGYNTDWIGAQNALIEATDITKIKKATIIGSGGVARAIAYALKENGIEVFISARNKEQREKLVNDLGLCASTDIDNQGVYNSDLVVNATPDSTTSCPLNLEQHKNVSVVFDVAFGSKMTALTTLAQEKNLDFVSGWRMLLMQGAKQFELYTGKNAPLDAMAKVLLDWFDSK